MRSPRPRGLCFSSPRRCASLPTAVGSNTYARRGRSRSEARLCARVPCPPRCGFRVARIGRGDGEGEAGSGGACCWREGFAMRGKVAPSVRPCVPVTALGHPAMLLEAELKKLSALVGAELDPARPWLGPLGY